MEIKNQYEENGYRITEYTNGTVVEEVITSNENIELTEQLTEEQLHRLKIESDLEYIKCLQEISLGI
ncbi:MAG: hypothetical protein K2L15_03665 [Eubacteriales bacterium]|nr:hypothetical protein [Eubacteriales bacterium]